jgi:pilus assembly protein CpaE
MVPEHNLNVVAIMRTEASGLQLDQESTDMNGTKIDAHVGHLKDVRPGVEIFNNIDVLLLDIDPKDNGDIDRLEEIVTRHFPDVPVLATAADATIQDVRRIMRTGLVDFLPQPISRADLVASLDLAASKRKAKAGAGPSKGKVISLINGGGGAGATTIAVQAGCLLASGDKKTKRNISVFDLDLQSGTAALYLDLDNRLSVADLMDSPERLDRSLLDAVTLKHESGLKLSSDFITKLLGAARQEFDITLLDLPPVWGEGMYTALQHSEQIFLVTQLNVAGIRQTRHQLNTVRMQGLPAEVKVVLNRYEKGWGKTVQLKEAEKALGCPINYCVPNDYKLVSEALNQGVALSRIKSRSKVEKGIQAMIDDTLRKLERGDGESAMIVVPSKR